MTVDEAKKYAIKAQQKFSDWGEKVALGKRYYRNNTDIQRTGAAAIDAVNNYFQHIGENPLRSADNRISENWFGLLITQKTAYMYTYPPVFTVGESKNDNLSDKVAEMFGDDYKDKLITLATNASCAGTAWVHYWYKWTPQAAEDTNGFHWSILDGDTCVGFTDPRQLDSGMIALVRRYKLDDGDDGRETMHYEVWDDKEVVYLKGDALEEEPVGDRGTAIKHHKFGNIPFVEFPNNTEKDSDLTKVKGLIDEHEKVLSGFANDLDDIQEVIWVLKNYDGETEKTIFVKQYDDSGNLLLDDDGEPLLKEVTKPVNVLQMLKTLKLVRTDENGGLDKLTNEIPCEARSVALELLRKQIFVSGQGVDPSPERLGQATGVFMDYLYQLLELKAGVMETKFEPALKKLVRAMLQSIGADRKVKIELTWTRNKPKMDNEIVQRLNSTPNTVMSDYTKRRKHPDIDDPDAEDKHVEDEAKAAMQNMMEQMGGQMGGTENE